MIFFNGISAADIILNGILAIASLAILWSMISLHRRNGPWSNFNLVHLIVNKQGFPDGAKCIEMGVFMLMSWAFVVQVTKGNLEEWFLIAYVGSFVTRGAFGAYLRSKSNDDETPRTVTTTQVVTTGKTVGVVKPKEPK